MTLLVYTRSNSQWYQDANGGSFHRLNTSCLMRNLLIALSCYKQAAAFHRLCIHLCTSILPILMPLQQARRAFSIDSPLRMILTPHNLLAKYTPQYWEPVGVVTVSSVNGRKPKPASTTCNAKLHKFVQSVNRINSLGKGARCGSLA